MNKEQFLKELEQKIRQLPAEEKDRVLEFYQEMIEDRVENGENEEQIIEEFGSLDSLAQKTLDESPAAQKKVKERRLSGGVKALLIAGSPIWLVFVLVGFVLYLVAWVVIAVCYVAVFALALAAVVGTASSIYLMCVNFPVAAFQFGACMLCAGLGIFSFMGSLALSRQWLTFTRFLLRKSPFGKVGANQ